MVITDEQLFELERGIEILQSENAKLKEHIKALEIESDDDAKAIKKYIEQKNNLKCCGNCKMWNMLSAECKLHYNMADENNVCKDWTSDKLTQKEREV